MTVGAKCLQVAQFVVVAVAVYMVDIKLASVDRNKSTHFASRFLVLSIDIFWSYCSFCFIPPRLLALLAAVFRLLTRQLL